jgi:hypothetical protein
MFSQVNIDDGFLNLMNADGVTKDDVKVPEDDLGKQIQGDFDDGKELLVTIVAAMGEEQVSLRTSVCCLIVFAYLFPSTRPSPTRRLQKAPTTSFNFCMFCDTICRVRDVYPAGSLSPSSLLFISIRFYLTRLSAIRYPLTPSFLAHGVACNCSNYSFAHFKCTHVMKKTSEDTLLLKF